MVVGMLLMYKLRREKKNGKIVINLYSESFSEIHIAKGVT